MVDLARHPLLKECYEVCRAIEECGASDKLTDAVTKASALLQHIDAVFSQSLASTPDLGCDDAEFGMSEHRIDTPITETPRPIHPDTCGRYDTRRGQCDCGYEYRLADYAAKLSAQLATAREDMKEECAKVCDTIAGNDKDFWPERRRGAGQCAAAIRALKP